MNILVLYYLDLSPQKIKKIFGNFYVKLFFWKIPFPACFTILEVKLVINKAHLQYSGPTKK